MIITIISGLILFFIGQVYYPVKPTQQENWKVIAWKDETYNNIDMYGFRIFRTDINETLDIFYSGDLSEGRIEGIKAIQYYEQNTPNVNGEEWIEKQHLIFNQIPTIEGKDCKSEHIGYPEIWHHMNGSNFTTIYYTYDYAIKSFKGIEDYANYVISIQQQMVFNGWRDGILDFENPVIKTICSACRDFNTKEEIPCP